MNNYHYNNHYGHLFIRNAGRFQAEVYIGDKIGDIFRECLGIFFLPTDSETRIKISNYSNIGTSIATFKKWARVGLTTYLDIQWNKVLSRMGRTQHEQKVAQQLLLYQRRRKLNIRDEQELAHDIACNRRRMEATNRMLEKEVKDEKKAKRVKVFKNLFGGSVLGAATTFLGLVAYASMVIA